MLHANKLPWEQQRQQGDHLFKIKMKGLISASMMYEKALKWLSIAKQQMTLRKGVRKNSKRYW